MVKRIEGGESLPERASYFGEDHSNAAFDAEANYCSLNEAELSETSRLALSELRRVGVVHLVVDYDGGEDEGFAYSCAAQTPNDTKDKDLEQLADLLQGGPLGEAPPFLQSPSNTLYDFSIYAHCPLWRTRRGGTLFRIECLFDELVSQLFGREFGRNEGGLKGSFLADLERNILTIIASEEG